MPKVGDRVVVDGSKVGGGRREGTLRKVVGSLIQVSWEDGTETLFAPGAGTVQYLPGTGKTNGGSKGAAKKTAAPKKAAPKAAAAKKPVKAAAKAKPAAKKGTKK